VHGGRGRGHAPQLPRHLVLLALLEARPARLVEADHGFAKCECEQRVVGRLELVRELVLQRLRREHGTAAKEDAESREREMIAVLVHHDVDPEVERVAATSDRAFGAERDLDATATTQRYCCRCTFASRYSART
jgi:hypothetical protein